MRSLTNSTQKRLRQAKSTLSNTLPGNLLFDEKYLSAEEKNIAGL